MSNIPGPGYDSTVDRLLREAGLEDDVVLRPALQEIRSLAAGEVPASAAVMALMGPAAGMPAGEQPAAARRLAAGPGTAGATAPAPTDELAARRRTKRRVTLTTLSVAFSLAAGGAVAVASDQGVRDSIGHVNAAVTSFVATTMGGAPVPAPAQPPAPAPATEVDPAQPSPGAAPAASASTAPSPAASPPGSGNGQPPVPVPSGTGQAARPNVVIPGNPAAGIPDVPVEVPVEVPLNGEGQPPTLPLPAPPPVAVPGLHP